MDRGVLGDVGRDVAGQQVGDQVGVLADPGVEGLGDPAQVLQQHAGVGRPLLAVAGGGPGDQRVDVVGDARATGRTAAGTSSCTCL